LKLVPHLVATNADVEAIGNDLAQLALYEASMPQLPGLKAITAKIRTLLPKIRLSKNTAMEVSEL